MKHSLRHIILIMLAVAFSFKVQAQASVTAGMFAEVIAAITATENSQMSFGKFSPGVTGGEIHLSPEGVRTITGSVVLSGGGQSAGSFLITGEDQATFSINLPTSSSLLTNLSGTRTMTVTNWISTPQQGIGSGILTGGNQEVKVGATLIIGTMNDNPVGIYTGTYLITFAYN